MLKGRLEDDRMLTGRGKYVSDWNLPGQAYGHFVRSDRAHADIVSLDATAALALQIGRRPDAHRSGEVCFRLESPGTGVRPLRALGSRARRHSFAGRDRCAGPSDRKTTGCSPVGGSMFPTGISRDRRTATSCARIARTPT